MLWNMFWGVYVTFLSFFALLLIYGGCGAIAERRVPVVRSSLQKWLHSGWTHKHEMPFVFFADQHYTTRNESSFSAANVVWKEMRYFFAGHTASLSSENTLQAAPDKGRYVIVKLHKLSLEGRRKARSILALHCVRDVHLIDDVHMLVYIDRGRAEGIMAAFAADKSGALQISSLVVLDIYSTQAGARLKLSRVIRFWLSCCACLRRDDGARCDFCSGGNFSGDYGNHFWGEKRKFRQKLQLEVQVALGREDVVEKLLEEVAHDKAGGECQWSLVSSAPGQGAVRVQLVLSQKQNSNNTEKCCSNLSKEDAERGFERSVICRCSAFIDRVIRHPAVRWVEIAVDKVTLLNDKASIIVQHGFLNGVGPAHPLWDAGINGTGEIIGIADSGLDFDSCFFRDPDLPVAIYPEVNKRHRKVVSFVPCMLDDDVAVVGDVKRGHGTHVSGTVAGSMIGKGVNSKYDGIAKGAKIFFNDLGCYKKEEVTLPTDIDEVFMPGYNEGARIFSNSWGFYAPNEYTAIEKKIDFLATKNDGILLVFAAGNYPRSGLLVPCRAKNMLCVGSHRNSLDMEDRNEVSTQSPSGPTYDGRTKPEILCPGFFVTSALSDGNLSTNQCSTLVLQGTSMATAVMSGSLALIRQHLRRIENISSPSGALLKALAIHSAVYLGKSDLTGFGRLDLSVFFGTSGVKGWFRDRDFVTHHSSRVYSFVAEPNAANSSDVVRVSLVWMDMGVALEGSTHSLVNDLDLVAVDSAGRIYFAGDGTFDNTDVIEQLRLPFSREMAAGLRVFVYGGSVSDVNKQPYALVVSGPVLTYVEASESLSNVKCPNDCSGNGECINGACNCFRGYRFIDCSLCDEETLCNGHGTCTVENLKCRCNNDNFADEACSRCKAGWYGPSCSSKCKCGNGGTCNKNTGECTCLKDIKLGGSGCFSGPNCEFCCRDFYGEKCNLQSYWCREDGLPLIINNSLTGYIQVNGYSKYSSKEVCRWVIEAPRNHVVRLEYLKLDLQEGVDFLGIFDSFYEDVAPLRVDTGSSNKSQVVVSSKNKLFIMFFSGWCDHHHKGILLRYTVEKQKPSDCHVVCVKNAICDKWNGGFCVCDFGYAGWRCGMPITASIMQPKAIMKAGDKGGAVRFGLVVNEEFPMLLTDLSHEWEMATLYVAFKGNFSTWRRDGVALRVSIFNSKISGINSAAAESTIEMKDICAYTIVKLKSSLKNKNGTMSISFTLLHNSSLSFTAMGSANYDVAFYLMEDAYVSSVEDYHAVHFKKSGENAADDNSNISMRCEQTLPSNIASLFLFPSSTTETSENTHQSHTFGSLMPFVIFPCIVFVGGLTAFFLKKYSRADYAIEDIAYEEVAMLDILDNETDNGGSKDKITDSNDKSEGSLLLSSMSQLPVEEGVEVIEDRTDIKKEGV